MSINLYKKFEAAYYPDIKPNEHRILIPLILLADDKTGFTYAGIKALRRRSKIELRTTIHRAIRSLVKKGWLKRGQIMFRGVNRTGYFVIIPEEKMPTDDEYRDRESEQTALREESKMLTHGVSKLLNTVGKNKVGKDREGKKLLASPKDNKKGIYNFPIGTTTMSTKKFKKKNENVGKSVEDIVTQQIKEKSIPTKITASYLYDIWEQACKKKAPQYIYIHPSGKIIGCLQNILKRIEVNPVEFIQFIVENWYGFGQMAKDMNCKSTCLYPSITYLTQYLDSAILFYGGKQVAKSTTSTEGYQENSHDSKIHIAEPILTPKSSSEDHSGGPYLTPKEQESQLEEDMKQFHKDKAQHMKEKKLNG